MERRACAPRGRGAGAGGRPPALQAAPRRRIGGLPRRGRRTQPAGNQVGRSASLAAWAVKPSKGPDWAAKQTSENELPSYSHGRPVTVLPKAPASDDNMFSGATGAYSPEEHHLGTDTIWEAVRQEAQQDSVSEPSLASSLHSTILNHTSMDKTMAFLLANKLQSRTLLGTHLMQLFEEAYADDASIMEACVADMNAVFDRDPACDKYTHCMLNFKGFQAVQAYRIAHWLWRRERRALAVMLQSRVSEKFHVDIHPAAQVGRGIMIDHASGVVIGETAVVGDNVSILHHVTLGGSGLAGGKRHPQVGNGVLLGAGVCCIGPVEIGHGCKIGAGSLVVTDLPDYAVAVGVPARQLRRKQGVEPNKTMDQTEYLLEYVI